VDKGEARSVISTNIIKVFGSLAPSQFGDQHLGWQRRGSIDDIRIERRGRKQNFSENGNVRQPAAHLW
jgi:hypothetical protein